MEMTGEILGQLLAACVGTAAFSALFGVPKKYWLDCGICGQSAGACIWRSWQLIRRRSSGPSRRARF